jgi:hypothetical protein
VGFSLHKPSVKIFKRPDEVLNLIIPILFLPLLAGEFVLGAPTLTMRLFLINLVEVGLGSAGHNGLSWSLLFITPEGRLWLRDKGGPRQLAKIFFVASTIFIFAAIIFCFFLDEQGFTLKLYLALDWFLIHHHSLNQTRGLSYIYSFSSSENVDSNLLKKTHAQQALAFNVLLGLAQIPMLHYIFDLNVLTTPLEKWLFAAITTFVVLWIILGNLRLPGNQRNRIFYLARLFYFPLTSFWLSAALAFRILHGIEYVFVYRKMISQSKVGIHLGRTAVFAYSALFFIGAIVLWTFSTVKSEGFLWLFPTDKTIPTWLRIMAALSVTRLYTHYYLDRRLFRMRDPITNKWIKRLLLDTPRTSS